MATNIDAMKRHALSLLPSLLANPVRVDGRTCRVCTEPIWQGAELCSACFGQEVQWGDQLADRVIPLTYASDQVSRQVRYDLRQYKDGGSSGDVSKVRLSWMLWFLLHKHRQCISKVSRSMPSLVLTVPSGSGSRPGGHPLEDLTGYFRLPRLEARRIRAARGRAVDPDSLEVDAVPEGTHVVIFDDTWTTGASAQGAAIAARRAGAAEVTVVVLGRWVNESWTPTATEFAAHPPKAWSPVICPVTGGACPV